MNTSLNTREQIQARLSEAVATRNTRSGDEQRRLLSELLAIAFETSRDGAA